MPFYDENRQRVNRFRHRNILVTIYRTYRGATHCRIEHEPGKRRCDKCGAAIQPDEVFIAVVSNNILCDEATQEAVEEKAKEILDHLTEGVDPTDNEPEEPIEPPADVDEDGPEPRRTGTGKSPFEAKIDKLGWAPQLAALARKVRKDLNKDKKR